jgi:hypothetical protein
MKKNELKKPALIQHKDMNKLFISNPVRRKILELFLSGGRYSVTDLSELLHIPDPRSHIRYIRGAGISISDYWVKAPFSRYKIYFLR